MHPSGVDRGRQAHAHPPTTRDCHSMDVVDEAVPSVPSQAAKKLAAAKTSNANKRQRLGEETYLQEKRDAAKVYRRCLKEKASAAS